MGSHCFQKNLSSANRIKGSLGYSYTTSKMHHVLTIQATVKQVNLPNLSSQKHAWNAKNSSARRSWHPYGQTLSSPSPGRRSRPPHTLSPAGDGSSGSAVELEPAVHPGSPQPEGAGAQRQGVAVPKSSTPCPSAGPVQGWQWPITASSAKLLNGKPSNFWWWHP